MYNLNRIKRFQGFNINVTLLLIIYSIYTSLVKAEIIITHQNIPNVFVSFSKTMHRKIKMNLKDLVSKPKTQNVLNIIIYIFVKNNLLRNY